jgi:hypothetical protein|tara:strand:- start:788 stop:1837 length:1050 start_codon:yes stop_codon:yes gene_type:complete
MDKTLKIVYYNNGVGESKDCKLLVDLFKNDFDILCNDNTKGIDSFYVKGIKNYVFENIDTVPDIAIFSNNFFVNSHDAKVKILLLNEEWFHYSQFVDLGRFDVVIVKSEYAKNTLKNYHNNVHNLNFWSCDMYDPSVKEEKEIFHLAGMSIQKGTEIVCNIEGVNVVDARSRFSGCKSNYTNFYQSEPYIKNLMNKCNLHLCPSIYEAHGHYMFEGLTCGKSIICTKIPAWEESFPEDIVNFIEVEEYHHQWFGSNLDLFLYDHPLKLKDNMYQYNQMSFHKELWVGSQPPQKFLEWPFRRSFTFNEDELKEKIEKHKNDTFSEKRRKFCLDLFEKRKSNFRKFVLDLL